MSPAGRLCLVTCKCVALFLNSWLAAAFRAGSVMGFLLTSMGLVVLYITLIAFRYVYGPHNDWTGLFEAITGYGLGGSSIALFGRVGGGIYTKAADVGADLVGKVEKDIPEDDPRNPGVIAGAQHSACGIW